MADDSWLHHSSVTREFEDDYRPFVSQGVRRSPARHNDEDAVIVLVLRSLPDRGVLARVSFAAANEPQAAAARAFIERQRDGWWYRARHYVGDKLVIEAA